MQCLLISYLKMQKYILSQHRKRSHYCKYLNTIFFKEKSAETANASKKTMTWMPVFLIGECIILYRFCNKICSNLSRHAMLLSNNAVGIRLGWMKALHNHQPYLSTYLVKDYYRRIMIKYLQRTIL